MYNHSLGTHKKVYDRTTLLMYLVLKHLEQIGNCFLNSGEELFLLHGNRFDIDLGKNEKC